MPIQKRKRRPSITLENVGPISSAKVEFGDLTILVGAQATGKSVFLQTLKLAIDRNHILAFFEGQNIEFRSDPGATLDAFFGLGMSGMLNGQTEPSVVWDGQRYTLTELTKFKKPKSDQIESLFYIPAQRVVSLPSGRTQTFGSFEFGDPYVLRYFSHQIHILLQNEFGRNQKLFPAKNRLSETLRAPIARALFGDATLSVDPDSFTKTITLNVNGLTQGLPFLAWSAGQREFVPLLLGLYWLCPAGKVSKRDNVEWVVIEEPEMGLHPQAIETFLLIVLELMKRGYRVIISTHSTTVLDFIWVMKTLASEGGLESDIRKLFRLNSNDFTKELGRSALTKTYKAYYFERGAEVRDISSLDPGSEDPAVSDWGFLTDFASRASETVSDAILRQAEESGR